MKEVKVEEEFVLNDWGEKYKVTINKEPDESNFYIDYERI